MAQLKKKWVAFKSNATVPADIVGERKNKKMQVGEPVLLPEAYANHVVQDGFAAFCDAPQKPVLKNPDGGLTNDKGADAAAKLEAARQRMAEANAHLDEVAGTDKEQAARLSLASAESELAAIEAFLMNRSLREDLMAEVDDVWAETVRHLPLTDGRKDPERDAMVITAVLRTGDRDVERLNFGRGNNARAGLMADGGYLRIDRVVNAALLIRKGDKVVALERDGPPVFEVLSVDDRSHLRLICELGDAN